MKPLLIILKTLIIGYLWTIVFIDGIRVVLLINWHFDIFTGEHWQLLKEKWNSGEAISRSEIAFFLILVSSIPLWLAGWIGLCLMKWESWLKKIILSPVYLYRKFTLNKKAPVVVKKKSITEEKTQIQKAPIIKKVAVKRPVLPSVALMQSNINSNVTAANRTTSPYTASKKTQEPLTEHALFNFDDDDFDLDFDFDKKDKKQEDSIPSALVVDEPKETSIKPEKDTPELSRSKQPATRDVASKPKKLEETSSKESHTPVLDVIKQKGYDVIMSAIIKKTTIDYVAVNRNQIILCLVDKEVGDWLADEEKFNDEEPLWFSESSHRISPVRKIDIARDILKTKLAVADMNYEIVPYVIIQGGNIINAEDMFEVWNHMGINVTRINRGSPKEIQLFSKSLETCEEKADKSSFEKLKKLIHSLA